jgi:epoxyqueuosine reductase
MDSLSQEITQYLLTEGASLVGFADLAEIPPAARNNYRYGISIGLALNPVKVQDIGNGAALDYYAEYQRANAVLNQLGEEAAAFLNRKGHPALARTTGYVKTDPVTKRSVLPHKTLATRAGLGWIGKCALLITPQYGAAIRFTSVLTNAVLETGRPVNESQCGECRECQDRCPAGAVSGKNWRLGLDREDFFHALVCHQKILERGRTIGRSEVTCGLCIKACPWTQKYLNRNESNI